jgi:hypothetical protein
MMKWKEQGGTDSRSVTTKDLDPPWGLRRRGSEGGKIFELVASCVCIPCFKRRMTPK